MAIGRVPGSRHAIQQNTPCILKKHTFAVIVMMKYAFYLHLRFPFFFFASFYLRLRRQLGSDTPWAKGQRPAAQRPT